MDPNKKMLYTKKEISEKLRELRSDPEKLSQFRRELNEKFKRLTSKLPKLETPLEKLISDAFIFLVDDYNYVECEKRIAHTGAIIKTYESQNVIVGICVGGYDFDTFCGISFQNSTPSGECENDNHRYSFRDLLRKRCPQYEHPEHKGSTQNLNAHLESNATALKEYAKDVLSGDFNVFRS